VDIENPSSSLAFSVNPKIVRDESRDLVTPVFWEDNYFTLLPQEKRSIEVHFTADALDGEKPVLQIEGWNIDPLETAVE
jgi:exo-1,4-beta-D-glucosaminidase